MALASPKKSVIEKISYVHPTEKVTEKVELKTQMARVALQVGVSEELMLKLRQAQDIESQKQKKDLNLEDTLEAMVEVYLNQRDPMRKAKRQKIRGRLQKSVEVFQSNQKNVLNGGFETLQEVKNNEIPGEIQKGNNQLSLSESVKNSSWEEFSSMVHQKKTPQQQNSKNLRQIHRKSLPAYVIHQVHLRDKGRCTYYDASGERCSSKRFLEIHHKKPISQGGDNSVDNLRLLCAGHHKVCHIPVFQSGF